MTSPAPGRCRPAAPPGPRPAPAAPPRRRIQPRDQDLRRPRPTASPPPSRRPCRQTSLTTGTQVLDMVIAIATIHGDTRYLEPILPTALDGLRPRPMCSPHRAARRRAVVVEAA